MSSPSNMDVPETLLGLVQHYSPSGEEGSAVAWLVDHMRKLGYTKALTDSTGNAVGILGDGPLQVVLLGHIDTVPGWIEPHTAEGRFYGRGSVDAKGPLAAFVDAAARVGAVPGAQMVVVGAVDEERDSTGARGIVDAYRPTFAIIGEPSSWDRLTLGYKGSAPAVVAIERSQSHSASGKQTPSEAAFELWEKLRTWAETFNNERVRVFDHALLTLRGIHSGGDGLLTWASLDIGMRLPTDLSPQAWYTELERIASQVEGARVETSPSPIPAYRAEKNTPLVRAFLSSIRQAGGEPGFVLKTGTADLNIVAPAWGCPAAAYGPGDSALDHTPEENIVIEEYHRSVEVLTKVLEKLTAS